MTTVKTYDQVVEEGRASHDVMVELERPSADRAILRMADPAKLNVLSAPLLTMLGFGIGLLAVDIPTAANAPAGATWAAFVWWAVSGIIAAFIGGAVAAANSPDQTALGVEQAPFLEVAQHDDRRGDRERDAEDDARACVPAEQPGEAHAEQRGGDDLHDRARHRDSAHREQFLERELQPDTEHQQNNTDFGEFVGHVLVGDEAGGDGADHHPGHEIADQGWKAQPVSERAEGEGEPDTNHDGRDQRRAMRHASRGPLRRSPHNR